MIVKIEARICSIVGVLAFREYALHVQKISHVAGAEIDAAYLVFFYGSVQP